MQSMHQLQRSVLEDGVRSPVEADNFLLRARLRAMQSLAAEQVAALKQQVSIVGLAFCSYLPAKNESKGCLKNVTNDYK